MPSMIYNYNTVFPAPQILCSPVPVLPFPVPSTTLGINHIVPEGPLKNPMEASNESKSKSRSGFVPQFQRPASQATSVKAEPGSALGSIASASVANKVSEN